MGNTCISKCDSDKQISNIDKNNYTIRYYPVEEKSKNSKYKPLKI